MIQRFLPQVSEGDKRIILVDGRAARRRQPGAGGKRHPREHGARRHRVRHELTPREQEICAVIGPELKRRGLVFAGIDVIDGNLTEINVTSPTGLRAIKALGGPDLAVAIWDVIEAKKAAGS